MDERGSVPISEQPRETLGPVAHGSRDGDGGPGSRRRGHCDPDDVCLQVGCRQLRCGDERPRGRLHPGFDPAHGVRAENVDLPALPSTPLEGQFLAGHAGARNEKTETVVGG